MSAPERAGSVLIIGGGIAGLAAGLRLAEAGVSVTILETRRKLGGRATSFTDQRSGLVLDNCQHVLLGCCTNYADFLRRLGAEDMITWHREQYWVEEGGRVSVLRPGALPAPLHFAGSMLRASFLSRADSRAIARASLAILTADRNHHQHETFADFLHRCGQPDRIVRRFWSPVVVSACNLDVDRVAASVALHVFQEGFLAHRDAAAIGVPSVPLVQLYDRAEETICSAGGRILLGESVEHIDDRSATTADGQRFQADRVICAVPVERVNKMVDAALRQADSRFAKLDEFRHSPILGVHLLFDRPVLPLPHAVLVDRPTQWLFRKDREGRSIHAVISAADAWMDLAEEQIAERVMADIRACFPGAAAGAANGQPGRPLHPSGWAANLISIRAVKEKRATFAPTPGLESLRPQAAPPAAVATSVHPGLILAGDYTATGWPATMEGAARSGYTAAAVALGVDPGTFLAPSLRPAILTRALAGG